MAAHEKVQLKIYCTPELHRRVKILAAERGVKLSDVVTEALEALLKRGRK